MLFPRLLVACFAFCVTASVVAQSSEADSRQTRATLDANGATRLETDMSTPPLGEERRQRTVGSVPSSVPGPVVTSRFERLLLTSIQCHLRSPYHYMDTGPDSCAC